MDRARKSWDMSVQLAANQRLTSTAAPIRTGNVLLLQRRHMALTNQTDSRSRTTRCSSALLAPTRPWLPSETNGGRRSSNPSAVYGREPSCSTLLRRKNQPAMNPGVIAGSCFADTARRGEDLVAAGLLMLAGPVDLDELDRWSECVGSGGAGRQTPIQSAATRNHPLTRSKSPPLPSTPLSKIIQIGTISLASAWPPKPTFCDPHYVSGRTTRSSVS